ncbi:MAG: hypothetical protein LLG02_06890 [Pelosinus sp.]|nr:hypothetical protein [Pelosinus sp.]
MRNKKSVIMLLVIIQVMCVMSIGIAAPQIRDWRLISSDVYMDSYVDIDKLNRQYDEYNNAVTINAWIKHVFKDKFWQEYPNLNKLKYNEEHCMIYLSEKNESKKLIEMTCYDFDNNISNHTKNSSYCQAGPVERGINRYITDMVNTGKLKLDDDGWVIKSNLE